MLLAILTDTFYGAEILCRILAVCASSTTSVRVLSSSSLITPVRITRRSLSAYFLVGGPEDR
jgi:hypothetical protein